MRFKYLLFFAPFIFSAQLSWAHPVPYKGSFSIMTWNQPFFNDTMAVYSFRKDAAVGASYMRMDMKDGEMKAYMPQFNYLAKRWNGLKSQANVYLVGGWGGYEFEGRDGNAALVGLETDYETRKVYFSGKVTSLFSNFDGDTVVAVARAGVSAYPAQFDELSSWLILDVQHNARLEQPVTVTPVLRLFYRNVLTEVGASFTGDWMINFMVHL